MEPRVQIRVVAFGSAEHAEAVELRRRVLRIPLGLDYTPAQLAAEESETLFIALEEGRVVGTLLMAPQSDTVVKMRQVAVEPARQGRGIGARLVRQCEEWAMDTGFREIELHARAMAIPFYEKLGYGIVGEPFDEVGIPHRKLQKKLARGESERM